MNYRAARRPFPVLGGTALLVIGLSCTPAPVVQKEKAITTVLPPAGVIHVYERKTVGCPFCLVHVATSAPFGIPLFDPAKPPPSPITVGYISNVGEGGLHEKRYDLKPSNKAQYELELSNDGGRTRWIIYELPVGTSLRLVHRSGHLEVCDTYGHLSKEADIGFKDCQRVVRYNPLENTSLTSQPLQLASADYSDVPRSWWEAPAFGSGWRDAIRLPPFDISPAWISCESGCCTLAM